MLNNEGRELLHENCTVEEVKNYFRRKSQETVRRWYKSGELEGFKIKGQLMFKRDAVLAFERKQKEQGK